MAIFSLLLIPTDFGMVKVVLSLKNSKPTRDYLPIDGIFFPIALVLM